MNYTPSKKIIRLVVVLVVITIIVLGYVGYQDKKTKEAKKIAYSQEILAKQKNLESTIKDTAVETDNLNNLKLAKELSKIEIKISSSTDTATIHQYGLDLKEALSGFENKRESEIKATTNALDQKNSEKLKTVVASRILFEGASQKLRMVTVPKDLANLHRQLIYSLDNSVIFLSQMEKVLTQPQAGMEASRLFLKETVYFFQIIAKINNYFELKQITYSAQEKMQLYVNY